MSIRAKLADLVHDLQSGFACGDSVADGVVQLRMNNVDTEGTIEFASTRRVPRDAVRDLDKFLIAKGDVMFNNTNSPELVGKSAVFRGFSEPVVFSNHFTRIRTRRERLEPRYLARWLASEWRRGRFARMCNQWVNQAAVPRDALLAMEVPVPSIQEQGRIADILDKADAIRRKRKQAIALTEDLLRSAFLDMFGDPVTNPKGWPAKPLAKLGELDRGRSRHRPRNEPALLGGKHPLIQTGEIANCDGVITSYEQTYSDIGLAQSKMWPAGTLCITIAANIAKTGVLAFDACFPDSVVGFTPGDDATTEYVQYWLSFLQPVLERQAPQSAQKNINLEILRTLNVPAPDVDLQRRFSTVVARIRRGRSNMRLALDGSENLFQSLVASAFAGSRNFAC